MEGCKVKQEIEDENDLLQLTTENRKRKVRERSTEASGGFVKEELDAAETLVDFAQQMQTLAKDTALGNSKSTWGFKKLRSIIIRKLDNHPVGRTCNSAYVSAVSLVSSSNLEAAEGIGFKSSAKPEVKVVSFESSKNFSFVDSRAESPNSPLPVVKEGCFSNYRVLAPNAEEGSMPSTFQQCSSILTAESLKSSFLRACKVEKDEQVDAGEHMKGLPSNAGISSKTSSRIKRESDLGHSYLMCGTLLKEDALELNASCENKSSCLLETLKANAKPEPSLDSTSDLFINKVSVGRHSGKQKPLLSEGEKEARRIRRVQANRESARQAIQRKQILCEELTKRAAQLELMNEVMKQKRVDLKQECQSLSEANSFLKRQCSTSDIVQGTCELLSQPSVHAGPASQNATHIPFIPRLALPYQVPPQSGGRSQSEGEEVHSFERSASAAHASSVAFGILLAMGKNGHMQTSNSSVSQSSIMIQRSDKSQSECLFSSLPLYIENAIASCSFQEIDVEVAHADATCEEQKLAPGHASEILNSVSSTIADSKATKLSSKFSAYQSASSWRLTGSTNWEPVRAIKPLGRQISTMKEELEKLYSVPKKEHDMLQGQERQFLHVSQPKDVAAVAKATEARRKRKEITRNKSLLRPRPLKD